MHVPLGLLVVGGLIALVVILFLLDRLALWMERKGWIYYRTLEPKSAMRNVLGGMEIFVHPEIRHVQEDKDQRAADTGERDPSER